MGEFLILCDHLSKFQKHNFAALSLHNLAEMQLSKKPKTSGLIIFMFDAQSLKFIDFIGYSVLPSQRCTNLRESIQMQ